MGAWSVLGSCGEHCEAAESKRYVAAESEFTLHVHCEAAES